MGVYIKGMEMPESCYEYPCGDNVLCECLAKNGRESYHHDEYGYPDGERQDWCPLVPVPPHGDLIDLNSVIQIATDWCPDDDGSVGKVGDLREMLDELENLPTIIPAEEGE